jgi:hypothetical protein
VILPSRGSQRRASLAVIEFPNFQPAPFSNTSTGRPLAKPCLALTSILAVAYVPVTSQVILGSIIGTVTDQIRGAVPGAMVKIASIATNEVRTTSTSSAGTYSVPNLAPGQYRVEVQQGGFKQFVLSSVARVSVIYADCFTALVDERGWLKNTYSADGLHPHAEGYKVMAPMAASAIQKALQ